MKALKDFQDNWNMSYMKSFQDNLECLIHERLEGFSGPSGHFVYEIATLRCMFVSSDIDSVARDSRPEYTDITLAYIQIRFCSAVDGVQQHLRLL